MILQPRSRPSLILASAWLQVLPSVNNPSGVLQTTTSRPPTLNARMPFTGMSSAGATRYQLSLMSLPGVVAGSLLVFIPAIGEFIIPALLGGSDTLMIGRVLWDEFFINRDWPVASAVSVVLLLILVLPIMWFQKMQARREEAML